MVSKVLEWEDVPKGEELRNLGTPDILVFIKHSVQPAQLLL